MCTRARLCHDVDAAFVRGRAFCLVECACFLCCRVFCSSVELNPERARDDVARPYDDDDASPAPGPGQWATTADVSPKYYVCSSSIETTTDDRTIIPRDDYTKKQCSDLYNDARKDGRITSCDIIWCVSILGSCFCVSECFFVWFVICVGLIVRRWPMGPGEIQYFTNAYNYWCAARGHDIDTAARRMFTTQPAEWVCRCVAGSVGIVRRNGNVIRVCQ